MKKSIKPSKTKKVIVQSLDWSEEIDIDSTIFDDVYMEAATRAIEKNKDKPNFSVAIVIKCHKKENENDPNKHYCYNTYFVLLNAALYDKAELLRLNFLNTHGIDIQKQSINGDEPGSQPPTSKPTNN